MIRKVVSCDRCGKEIKSLFLMRNGKTFKANGNDVDFCDACYSAFILWKEAAQ